MSYTINLTNGSSLVPGDISDGTIDTTHSSLTLIGRNYAGYGQFLNDNFVHLLENFAYGTSPANPLKGQLWWDTTNNILRVWSGSSWKISTGATSGSTSPGDLSALGCELWFDSVNQQLKVYSGTSWITVGPVASSATGNTGAVPAVITDSSSGSHVIIEFIINGTIYAILSKDTFNTVIPGFASIIPGLNFSTLYTQGLNTQSIPTIASTLVQRDGTGSINVNNINASGTITAGTITATTITSPSGIATFTGNLVGNVTATNISAVSINTQTLNATTGLTGTLLTAAQPNVTSLGNITNLKTNGITNIVGYATYNGAEIATGGGSASFSAINNTVIGNTVPSTGAFTSVTVNTSLAPVVSANATVNLGAPNAWWNNIYGRAIQAAYADLAERFHADAEYAPGTVVEMGGTAEITKVVAELSDKVFGVISTNAAYLMNSQAGSDATHPPIAMSGRVPVRVTGIINKGDRLVSAGNGMARAGKQTELTPFNVIGRSLVNKADPSEGLIEAIVKINS